MFGPRTLTALLTPTILILAILAGCLCANVPLLAADAAFWPQFHGPGRDNKSAETGLLKKWPEGGPKLLWTARGIGHGFSSVSIADGKIYTAGDIGNKTMITAMDMDGKILWQVANGKAWTASSPGSRGTPTVDGRLLYHESPHGDVVCLDARTGKRVWGLNILEKFNSKNITWALAESLLIDGDRVVCRPGGPETCVVALDKRTGRTVWKSPSAGGDLAGYCTMALVEYQGLRMILSLTSKAMIGVNADTGKLLWRVKHVSPYNENITTPVFHDGQVFFSTRTTGSVMLKINVDGDKAAVEEVWRSKQLDNQHGGTILVDGCIHGACCVYNNAGWVCLDWKTGQMKYAGRGVGRGSLTYADGMLYILSERSKMGLVKPTPEGQEVISEFRIPKGGKGLSWAHPVVCGGRLYIRHGDFLYVYDVKLQRKGTGAYIGEIG